MFSGFPATQGDDSKSVAIAYLEVLDGIPETYILAAIDRFRRGNVEDQNKRFAPSSADLASDARRIWHKDLEWRARDKQAQAQIEHRVEPLTDDEIEDRKQFVSEQMAKLQHSTDPEEHESYQRMKAMLARQNADHLDPRPIEERLNLTTPNTTGETE